MKTVIIATESDKILTIYEFDRKWSCLRRERKKWIRSVHPNATIKVKHYDPSKEKLLID